MIIRAITEEELARFTHLPGGSQRLSKHVAEAFESGLSSEDWCLVAEQDGRWLGRAFLRAAPAGTEQIFLHFFDVDLSERAADTVAQALIEGVVETPAASDTRTILFALDDPHPWHPEPARRRAWFDDAGFAVARDGVRWEWPPGRDVPPRNERLSYRSVEDAGEDAFREAIARVSDDTLDARLQEMRTRLGREGDAAEHFRLLTGLRREPGWFQLAFEGRELAGLIACGGAGDDAFVAYIGVVPEKRGRGLVDELVTRATRTLTEAGETRIVADTDVANEPMGRAFERNGYRRSVSRTELVLTAAARSKRASGSSS